MKETQTGRNGSSFSMTSWLALAFLLSLCSASAQPTASTFDAAFDNGVRLGGMAVPGGEATTCWFQWGVVGDDYPSNTVSQPIGDGMTVVYVTDNISATQTNVQYHYQLVASNSSGVVYGPEKRFGLGFVSAWGTYVGTVPSLTNVVVIAAGVNHSLALKSDGTVSAWGNNSYNQIVMPFGLTNVVSVAAGYDFSLALKNDGTVVAWSNSVVRTTLPSGLNNVVAIAAGYQFALALKKDGTVAGWGTNTYGQIDAGVLAGLTNVVAIAAGYYHGLALKNDGTVVAWGRNTPSSQATVPDNLTGVVAIAGNFYHSLALKNDGSVTNWGDASAVTGIIGVTNAIGIAAGNLISLVLEKDGTVIAGGTGGNTNPPDGLDRVVAIAQCNAYSMALSVPEPTPLPPSLPLNVSLLGVQFQEDGSAAILSFNVPTDSGITMGTAYTVQYTDSLTPPTWNDIDSVTISNPTFEFIDNVTNSTHQRFYRLKK